MREITIKITEEQEKSLKLFAAKHHEGAPDNLATRHPLFIVQSRKDDEYRNVAYFFILEEARKYTKYQSHNLVAPKIYGEWAGYSNDGEYHHFYTLLLSIGKQLNEGK